MIRRPGLSGSGLYNAPSRALLPTPCSQAFALCPLCLAQERLWCDHDYPRWGAHTSTESTVTFSVLGAPVSLIGSEPPHPPVRGSDLLSQIETFVTLCGMVWLRGGLRAKVLGRLGRKLFPHPRACALSCPLLAIYGPGSLGHLTRPFALPHPKHLKPLLASWVVLARIVLLRRVCGLLFFLYYLQTFDLLEGEAHDAAVLALVLKVDCLLVVVDEDLRGHPAAVVEPLRPLRDVFVLYLLGLLAHPFAPCLAGVSLPQRGSM